MKNFKLFLLSGVFCILIVSVAIAATRKCTATRPTCAELGYDDLCQNKSAVFNSLKCPWDLTKTYCPGATSPNPSAANVSGETVDCTRKDCATLGFVQTVANCGKYAYLPCPFDEDMVFCAQHVSNVGATIPSDGITGGGGTSAVVGGIQP